MNKILGTTYSFFFLPVEQLKKIGSDSGPSKAEIDTFHYPQVRNSLDPTKRFDFNKHKAQYDALAKGMLDFVQGYMTQVQGLTAVEVAGEAACPVFMTHGFNHPDDAQRVENASKTAVVLMQGTGAVRAGIWARSVCINDGTKLGSMLPQIDWARKQGHEVIVMNPNVGQSMQDHCVRVWREFVEPAGFSKLLVIAHSAGGKCVTAVMEEFPTFFLSVDKLAYTDCPVTIDPDMLDRDQKQWVQAKTVHYVKSNKPLGT